MKKLFTPDVRVSFTHYAACHTTVRSTLHAAYHTTVASTGES
jgi:hypothetical protein